MAVIQAGSPEGSEVFQHLGVHPGDVIDGKLRVSRVLGVGGMSYVLEATHLLLDETVALKCLHPLWAESALVVDRFSREARSVAKIKSDHVARVYDVGRLPNGLPYMVMEYLRGDDLGRLLERSEPMSIRECAGWVIEACEGLAEAHALGIVHRDVKPENLFLVQRSDGRRVIKLLDFGISKQLLTRGTGLDEANLARTLELVGTPLYMSPEQVRLSRELDHRTDVWSLGAVLYEMLAGRPPFMGEGVTDLCARIIEDQPVPVSSCRQGIPRELDRVVGSCLQKDADERYPSVAELAAALLPYAHPRYHGQVDRIIRTVRAAGLTKLELSSVPPPAAVLGSLDSSLPSLPHNPTLPDFATERTASQSGVVSRDLSTLPAPGPRKLYFAIAAVVLLLLGAAAAALFALRAARAPEQELAEAPAPSVAPTATASVAPTGASTKTAAEPPSAEPSAEPPPSMASKPTVPPVPRAVVAPRPATKPQSTPPASASAPPSPPKPGLDIVLSR